MDNKLITTTLLAGSLLALACSAQAAEKVVVVPLFSATGDAAVTDVLAGKTFSNATAKGLTGTLTLDPATGDATAADVLVGTTFSNATANGLSGTRSPAPVAATGQATCYAADGSVIVCAGTGQDGDHAKGETVATRFADNGDGTVTDNLTGLVWLQDASCKGAATWDVALTTANTLATGDVACALTDGSAIGDWRLPNLFELESLRDMSQTGPALISGSFINVKIAGQPESYWTSTTLAGLTSSAWAVEFLDGQPFYEDKGTASRYIWPVRDK